jgi:hypothetical protein
MLESISLEIANYWTENKYLAESNENCGTLVAFDWRKEDGKYYLSEINTNIDLGVLECENFKFDVFVEFLKKNNFNFVLGLRNNDFFYNPSKEWTDELKKVLESNEMGYDEYITDKWPAPIPEFDILNNVFILRYAYNEYCKVDKLASNSFLFGDWILDSDWKEYYREIDSEELVRVTVFCSMRENFILKDKSYKTLFTHNKNND